jgi:hypothetical protein
MSGTIEPRARTTDPETSHEAAVSVSALRQKQDGVLGLLRRMGPMTLEELVSRYRYEMGVTDFLPQQSDSGIRTRCSELVRMGLVEDSGQRARTASGRKAVVWRTRL